MTKLYVEFTRPKESSIISFFIMLFERSKYSHVRFQWNENGETMIYEASGSSVKFLGQIAQSQHPVIVASSFSLELNHEQWEKFKHLRMKYAGVQYGVFQVFGIVLSRVLFLKRNPFSKGHVSQICSEVVARILHDVFQLSTEMDFDMAGPKKIHQLLINYEKNVDIIKVEI